MTWMICISPRFAFHAARPFLGSGGMSVNENTEFSRISGCVLFSALQQTYRRLQQRRANTF